MYGVRGEAGMKEGGAGNDSRSSGTITGEILGGLRADMGGRWVGGRRGMSCGGNGRWDGLGLDGYKPRNRDERNRRPVSDTSPL